MVTVLTEEPEQFLRSDWCPACWDAPDKPDRPNVFSVWRGRAPRREEKKKLFVDDDLLVNFFQRLAEAEDDAKLNFRFVLALVLMRKKLFRYDKSAKDEQGRDVWLGSIKDEQGQWQSCQVIDVKLDPDAITEVNAQLSQILQGEL